MSVKYGILITDSCSDSVILTPAQARKVVRIFDRQAADVTSLSKHASAYYDDGRVMVDTTSGPIVEVTKRDINRLREILGGSHV